MDAAGDTMAEYALQAGHLRLFEELVDEYEACSLIAANGSFIQCSASSKTLPLPCWRKLLIRTDGHQHVCRLELQG